MRFAKLAALIAGGRLLRRLSMPVGVSIVIVVAIVAAALLVVGGRGLIDESSIARYPGPPEASTSAKSSNRLTLLSAQVGAQRRRQVASRIAGLRLMNYYPAADGWTRMWTNWNPSILKDDFARIRGLGANAVRITVFPNIFGWPRITERMAVRFAKTLKIAASSDLGVQVTLFDWWGSYNEITQSQAWLKALLRSYASDPEIQLVELKNEVNPSDSAEVAWVRALLPTLRSVLPRTPSTVSVSGTEGPKGFVQLRNSLTGAPLDVADMHFYGDEASAYSWMLAAKQAAGSLPLFLGEIGSPAMGDGDPEAADLQQAHWFSVVFAAARAAGVSVPAPWILYDFKPGAIPEPQSSDPSSYYYGLYSATGQWRPSVSVVQQAFVGRNLDTSNLNFNLGGRNNMPMVWTPYLPRQGKLAYDSKVGHLGRGSVRLSDTRLSRIGAPSFYLTPTNPAIPGQLWTVSVWAKGNNVNGTAQLALSWFNSDGSYIGETSSGSLPHGNPNWTKLVVRTLVPSNARSVTLYLKSYDVAGTVWFDDVHITVTP